MNKRNFAAIALTTVLTISAAFPVFAADLNAKSKTIINFDALDTDRNGTLTQTELDVSSDFKGDKFTDLDKNGDGVIDTQEMSLWAKENNKGIAAGSVTTSGAVGTSGTIGVPSVDPNVNATVNGSVTKSGAGAAIGAKGDSK